jgi:acyl dehydratase
LSPRTVALSDLPSLVGQPLGESAWVEVTQEMIDLLMGINYGLNRCRFPAPVPSGSRVRAELVLAGLEPLDGGAVQLTTAVTIRIDGGAKPACVAETLSRFYPD